MVVYVTAIDNFRYACSRCRKKLWGALNKNEAQREKYRVNQVKMHGKQTAMSLKLRKKAEILQNKSAQRIMRVCLSVLHAVCIAYADNT